MSQAGTFRRLCCCSWHIANKEAGKDPNVRGLYDEPDTEFDLVRTKKEGLPGWVGSVWVLLRMVGWSGRGMLQELLAGKQGSSKHCTFIQFGPPPLWNAGHVLCKRGVACRELPHCRIISCSHATSAEKPPWIVVAWQALIRQHSLCPHVIHFTPTSTFAVQNCSAIYICFAVQALIGQYYNIPSISVRAAAWPLFRQGVPPFLVDGFRQDKFFVDPCHPSGACSLTRVGQRSLSRVHSGGQGSDACMYDCGGGAACTG